MFSVDARHGFAVAAHSIGIEPEVTDIRTRTGGSSIVTRPSIAQGESETSERSFHEIAHLHQIIIVDGYATPDNMPDAIKLNMDFARSIYASANCRLWNGEELRSFIVKEFGNEVLQAFDRLKPYSYKSDLARFCLLYATGGMYVDLGVRLLGPWRIPQSRQVAACRDVAFLTGNWAAMQTGLLWSAPGQLEFRRAIDFIVENCRSQYYGEGPLHPTGPVLLGKAMIAALADRSLEQANSQYIGVCRPITPESDMGNLCYISPDDGAIALRTKNIPGDLSHMGIIGGNNYNQIWRSRRVYRKLGRRWDFSGLAEGKARLTRKIASRIDDDRSGTEIAQLHQIAPLSDVAENSKTSDLIRRNIEYTQQLYGGAKYRLWSWDEIREMIRVEFDGDVVRTLDELIPLARRMDLASYCLLYAVGGLYFAHSLQLMHVWKIPKRREIAAFRSPPSASSPWTSLHAGLLWSRPKRREWSIAIDRVVGHHRVRAADPSKSSPSGEAVLGQAFAAVMAERRHDKDIDDQWIGDIRVAGNAQWPDLAFIAPDRLLVAVQMARAIR